MIDNNIKWLYVPRTGDTVIGTVVQVDLNGWTVDIESPCLAILQASEVLGKSPKNDTKDLETVLKIGNALVAKIAFYDGARNPQLTVSEPGLGRITRGQFARVPPPTIPWIIGRNGSMISMIKAETKVQIVMGLNGVILVTGKNAMDEELALIAIKAIEEDQHTIGYFDRIALLIREYKQKLKNQPMSNQNSVYCNLCGSFNPQIFEFCGKCGSRLRNDETRIY